MKSIFLFVAFFVVVLLSSNVTYVEAFHDERTTRGADDPIIEVHGDNVYVVWQDSYDSDFFDLSFRKSTDGGKTFDDTISLTQERSFYPTPIIAVSGNNIYVVFEDRKNPDGDDVIMFTKSHDGGDTFDVPKTLDPEDDESKIYRPIEIIETNDNLYIFASFWDRNTKQNNMILFTSNDYGQTFSEPVVFFDHTQWDQNVDFNIHDKTVYVLADDQKDYDEMGSLNLRKIFPDGTFSDIVKVNGGNTAVTNAQLAVSGDNVYAAWRAWDTGRWHLTFAKSNDGGNTFDWAKRLNTDNDSIDIHGSQGSHIVALDDSVYVKWNEVYYDGNDQTEKIWIATSHDNGNNFDVDVNPFDYLLEQYGDVLMYPGNEHLYFMVMGIKNPPYNDGAIYFSQRDDGTKSFTKTIDLLEHNPPEFRFSGAAADGNNIHVIADGGSDVHCILHIGSNDGGQSFSTITNLDTKGDSETCLGIKEEVPLPLQQIKSHTLFSDVKCNDDASMGYILALRERDEHPVCITADSYLKLLDRNWLKKDSQEILSLQAAEQFILTFPTYSFDGIHGSLDLKITNVRKTIPPVVTIDGAFQTKHSGYGDRTGHDFPHEETTHEHTVSMTVVQINKIHSAIIDDEWNEIKQLPVDNVEPEESFHGHNYGPTSYIALTIGDGIDSREMVPLLIEEFSENVEEYATFWQFQPIRPDSAKNKGITWGFLPDNHRHGWEFLVDEAGNNAWDDSKISQDHFGIPADGHGYPAFCGKDRMSGQSWHPSGIPIVPEAKNVLLRSGQIGYYPNSDGIYNIDYLALFDTVVNFPENTKIIENNKMVCVLEDTREDATHAYYTKIVFQLGTENED